MTILATMIIMVLPNGGELSLRDIHRFPHNHAECRRRADVAQQHLNWLQKHRPFEQTWIAEATWRQACWEALARLKLSVADVDVTRAEPSTWQMLQLAILRQIVDAGNDSCFWRGIMPDHLPLGYFLNLDR